MENEIKNFIIKTEEYFQAFTSKDLETLSEIYSDNINLIDWVGTWVGSKNVLDANVELFKNDFELKVLDITQYEDRTFNTILIEIGGESFEVMDVIKFDKDFKIEYIRAYKG
jgi:hypothetical protein